jgi:hypothetical protein
MGARLLTSKQSTKSGVETRVCTQDQVIQKCTFCQLSDVDIALGLDEPTLKHYEDHRQIVNSARYCIMFVEEFKPTIYNEQRPMLT